MALNNLRLLLASAALIAGSSMPAQALSFEVQGALATVSGEVDYPDQSRLKEVVQGGVKIIVLKDIAEGRSEAAEALSRSIAEMQLSTVIGTDCSINCVILFVAGKERLFSKQTSKVSVARIVGGLAGQKNSTGSTRSPYAVLDAVLNNTMPRSLLNKYTTNWDGASMLRIIQPNTKFPDGTLLECAAKQPCQPPEGNLTALNIGFITSSQVFDLATQERVSISTSKTRM